MTLDIRFKKSPLKSADTAIIAVYESKKPGDAFKALDKDCKALLKDSLERANGFSGKLGQTRLVTLPKTADFAQVLLSGLGKPGELTALRAEEAGGKAFPVLKQSGAVHAVYLMDEKTKLKQIDAFQCAAYFAAGMKLRSYDFEKYKTKTDKKDTPKKLKTIDVTGSAYKKSGDHYKTLSGMIDGVFLARDLVNEPPNHLYPDAYARRIQKELKPLGVEIEILDEKKMQKLGMGAALAVGMGSDFPPRMVIMRWRGKGAKNKALKSVPLALVGKGVTFDTGGISLKPGAGMEDMKMDMAGSAAVVGAMKAIAARKVKADVVGIVGLVENMPSSRSYRPADIITSYAGKTIEVLNTDAEGRLVLVDALAYVQKTYKPEAIVDLATLTGAMMVALAHEYCGAFVNDDGFWKVLENAGEQTGEKLWRMPLDEVWRKNMESDFADLRNLGKSRYGGACTAAGFLEHFIEKGVKWAHMDIAGTAWIKADKPTVPKYGTGFGVRVLEHLACSIADKK